MHGAGAASMRRARGVSAASERRQGGVMARCKGCNFSFLVQLGQSCSNKSHYLLVSMLGARPTVVLLPFPRTM